jgi:hypothetical protein
MQETTIGTGSYSRLIQRLKNQKNIRLEWLTRDIMRKWRSSSTSVKRFQWHLGSIEIRVASIACFLPCKENRDAVYAGVTAGTKEIDGAHTPEAARLDRAKEHQIQKNDAEMRRTAWLAEGLSAGLRIHSSGEDADGEADPDYYSQNREVPWSFEKETPLLDPTQVIDTQMPSESSDEFLGISPGIDTMDVQRALVSEDQDYSTTQFPSKGAYNPPQVNYLM